MLKIARRVGIAFASFVIAWFAVSLVAGWLFGSANAGDPSSRKAGRVRYRQPMHSHRLIRAAPAVLVLLAVAGCSQVHRVDGFPVGNATECNRDFTPSCEQVIDAAIAALDERDPGHAKIDQTSVYDEDRSDFPEGTMRSGMLQVVVFDFADGTQRAVGAYCGPGQGGGQCWPVPHYTGP